MLSWMHFHSCCHSCITLKRQSKDLQLLHDSSRTWCFPFSFFPCVSAFRTRNSAVSYVHRGAEIDEKIDFASQTEDERQASGQTAASNLMTPSFFFRAPFPPPLPLAALSTLPSLPSSEAICVFLDSVRRLGISETGKKDGNERR